jgi:hypothetical protein
MDICLRTHMDSSDGWGHVQGRETYEKLRATVEAHPTELIFRISLEGVRRTDISFPRESVIELAKNYRGYRGFCLTDLHDLDLLENWDAAARKREQPLMVWNKDMPPTVLGPEPSTGLREMFQYVLSVPIARTSEAAANLHLKIPNASNKLKQLWLEGYILRKEQSASSGGVEYEYIRIA